MSQPFANTKLGIAINTVAGLPQAAKEVATDVAQAVPRSLLSAGMTMAKPLGGPDTFAAKQFESPVIKEIFSALIGDEEVKPIEDRIASAELKIKESPYAREIGLDKFALPLALGGVFGGTVMDLTPIGGQKKGIEALATEVNPRKIARTLQELGVDDKIVPRFANLFAKTKTVDEAQKVKELMDSTLGVNEIAKKLATLVPEFQSMRDEMEAAYTAERSRRLNAVQQNMNGISGEEGFFKSLDSLKGKLLDDVPKLDGIREKFTQDEVDSLYNAISNFEKFTPFDKITAADGIMKLLEGEIPQQNQIDKLSRVFGPEIAKAASEGSKGWKRFVADAVNIVNIPRVFQTIGDLSGVLRQGVVQSLSHPIRSSKALPEMLKQGFDEMNMRLWLDELRSSPDYPSMEKAGLYIGDPTMEDVMKREEMFISNIPDKIPIIKSISGFSQRSYLGFLNKVRVDSFRSMVKHMEETGNATDENLKAIASWVNNSTGRGELGKLEGAAEVLNAVLFSPRLMASRINTLNPAYYWKMPGPVRREALKDMAKAGSMLMLINGIYAMNGYDTELDNATSADFLKVREGDKRIDFAGGYGQYIRTVARILNNGSVNNKGNFKEFDPNNPYSETRGSTILNFIRSKLAPVPSSLTDAALGKDFMGEEFDMSEEAISYLMPLYTEDMIQLMKNPDTDAYVTAFLSMLGAGLQIYDKPKSTVSF